MSGTSADGVDGVIATFEHGRLAAVESCLHLDHPPLLREQLIALGRDPNAAITLSMLATLDVAVARQFASLTQALLARANLQASAIRAIGSHGQTIFHDPRGTGSSIQIGDPNYIAALTGIKLVADFRRMDIALGGEGAPLVPAFHQATFASSEATAVVNIGGIANVTLLMDEGSLTPTTGFDCGPGNALMDEWANHHLGRAYDFDGRFAASGSVIKDLLEAWLSDSYFKAPAPKSTGRAQFNINWAKALAGNALEHYAPADIQATFCELTARTITDALPPSTRRVLVCGGGGYNGFLMARIAMLFPNAMVQTTAVAGLAPEWVEATAFAWLAYQRIHDLPGNLQNVTGASRPAVLGGLYG